MKRCTQCGELKPATVEYFCHKSHSEKLRSKCKTCQAEYHRCYYKEHRNEVRTQQRRYDKEHRDQRREYQRRYREKNRDQAREPRRPYYEKNQDKMREYQRRYREAHKDQIRERRKQCPSRWYQKNPERGRVFCRAYRRNRPNKIRELNHASRAEILGVQNTLTEDDLERILKAQGNRCLYCGVDLDRNCHTDHFIPMCKGGDNSPYNLVFCCASCNQKKSHYLPEEWDGWNGVFPVEWEAEIE